MLLRMMLVAIFGVSFLTPLGALFGLAAALPLAALLLTERRARQVRALLGIGAPRVRSYAAVVGALTLLPVLVGLAAAQPVVVRRQFVRERGDAQAFLVFDVSRSMLASSGPGLPSRLTRAKRLALALRAALPDVPVGIATMTDRLLPDLLPTTDPALFARTLAQSVAIDQPPPSLDYGRRRATNLQALAPLATSNLYSSTARRRLLVLFTDGEGQPLSDVLGLQLNHYLAPVFVQVWAPGERIYARSGRPDPYYTADPSSASLLAAAGRDTGGSVYPEAQLGRIEAQTRRIVGRGPLTAQLSGYARVTLAPWFALAGGVPLAYLLWRRNA